VSIGLYTGAQVFSMPSWRFGVRGGHACHHSATEPSSWVGKFGVARSKCNATTFARRRSHHHDAAARSRLHGRHNSSDQTDGAQYEKLKGILPRSVNQSLKSPRRGTTPGARRLGERSRTKLPAAPASRRDRRWPGPPLRPKRSPYGLAGLRGGPGQRQGPQQKQEQKPKQKGDIL